VFTIVASEVGGWRLIGKRANMLCGFCLVTAPWGVDTGAWSYTAAWNARLAGIAVLTLALLAALAIYWQRRWQALFAISAVLRGSDGRHWWDPQYWWNRHHPLR